MSSNPEGGTLPLFVFGSQGSSAYVDPLLNLLSESSRHSHTSAFLQLALDAVRTEIQSITNAADLSVLPAIGELASLRRLSAWHRDHSCENATINGVLLVIAQAGHLVYSVERDHSVHDAVFSPRAHVAGFCTGAITATAVSAATDGIWDLIKHCIEAVRLVFWISLRSAKAAERICRFEKADESKPWACVLATVDASKAEQCLARFNKILCLGPKDALVLTASAPGSVSIGGDPHHLEVFVDWVKSGAADVSPRCSYLKIYSPYHHPALLQNAFDLVMRDVERRRIAFRSERKLGRPLFDIVTGDLVEEDVGSLQIIRKLVEANLFHCNHFDLVVEAVAAVATTCDKVAIYPTALSAGLAVALRDRINVGSGDKPTSEIVDLSIVEQRKDGPLKHISAESEEVAIVAMSCRLPGGVASPEQAWEFMQAGKSGISEIPPHLFNIDDYYGEGLNKTQVRHMFPLDKDVIQTMDIRLPNISPKEAEQMDPQHRLAILLAYEVLQKGGYNGRASQSFDNRRIAYFAAAASDDYRENASSAPTGISSYFISGCIRAFIPGALSFALCLEGPSNTVDSGEVSGLVTLEHAQHALLAKQCDVALAGAFHINTQPSLFIGWDVDGLLSHAGEDRTFSADKDGIVRGDGAVVFLLKRLSDAIAEGDEVLATLPAVSHRTLPPQFDTKDIQTGIANAMSAADIHPQDVVHVEAAGWFDARGEAAEFTAVAEALRKGKLTRPVTLGSTQPNFGASEAAVNAVAVMKAVLMLQHGKVPKQPRIHAVSPTLQALVDSGSLCLPADEQPLARADGRAIVAVHGLALAGIQAVGFVRAPPTAPAAVNQPAATDRRYVLSLSAKTPESLEKMRADLVSYIRQGQPNLLRLSYTLLGRRLLHQHRITIMAGTPEEAVRELSRASVTTIKEQDAKPQPKIALSGKVNGLNMLMADPGFKKIYDGIVQPLAQPPNLDAVNAVRAEVTAVLVLRSWGIEPGKIIVSDRGLPAALLAAKAIGAPEALFLAALGHHPKALELALQRLGTRTTMSELVLGTKTVAACTQLASVQHDLLTGLVEGLPAQSPGPPLEHLLDLSRSADPVDSIWSFAAQLHSSGTDVAWHEAFGPFQIDGSLRYLPDAPVYAPTLTKHWIDYRHRNLRRGTPAAEQCDSVSDVTSSERSTPTTFPMLGTCSHYSVDKAGDRAVFENAVCSDPMVRFVRGHLVNDVPLAPATLYADLCMSAALEVHRRAAPAAEGTAHPELRDLEMRKPLVVADPAADERTVIITVIGSFAKGQVQVEISSRSPDGVVVQHVSAEVVLADTSSAWAKLEKFVSQRFKAVCSSPNVNNIDAKLAYNAFETVVSYTEDSGFRGIQSIAMLEDQYEAATTVKLSPDAPKGIFAVNPCLIDSLGQITGFICNAVADRDVVYIAEAVKMMRFSPALQNLALAGGTMHAYCSMQPVDEQKSMFEGAAYFFDTNMRIVGEMDGVRYKRIPRSLLDMLLPNPNKKSAGDRKNANAAQPARKDAKPAPMQDKVATTMNTILETIAVELGISTAALTPDVSFADLGVDSLMQLVILGSLTNLPVELPPSLFMDCLTPADLEAWLAERLGGDLTPPTFDRTVAGTADATQGHAADEGNRVDDAMATARNIIATELGINTSELDDQTNLADAGCDSLMSLLIIGTLNTELNVELPPSLFLDCNTLAELRAFFATLFPSSEPQSLSLPIEHDISQQLDKDPLRGIRIQAPVQLQKGLGPNLFLLPDGSGAAGAYAAISELGCNLFGLNSPFMADPSKWTGGVSQLACAYLASIRTVQPQGPYYLGGWSFGGVAAFEVCRILSSSSDPQDRVELLVLLDSPPPCRYPPLPVSVVDWIFSSADIPTPPTLSPRLFAHFQATVDNLDLYGDPGALTRKQPRRVVVITAQQGITVSKPIKLDHPTVRWLVKPRAGLGTNGWEQHLPGCAISVLEIDANHFNMVHPPKVQQLSRAIREAMHVLP